MEVIMHRLNHTLCLKGAIMMGLLYPALAFAQPHHRGPGQDREALRERMERLFVAYLTEELDLSVEQGQRFWPLYNELKKEMDAAEESLRDQRKVLAETEWKNQSDFEQALDGLTEAESGLAGLRADFLKDISREFDADFALRCMKARKSFESDMRERMSQRMNGPDRNGPGPRRPPGRQRR